MTDRVPPKSVTASYTIPVKHERRFRGSEGELEFTRDAIYYVTKDSQDQRVWRLNRDIVSVWSDDPYRLEIRAYDNNRREFSRTATYKFDLKQKLDPDFYRRLFQPGPILRQSKRRLPGSRSHGQLPRD